MRKAIIRVPFPEDLLSALSRKTRYCGRGGLIVVNRAGDCFFRNGDCGGWKARVFLKVSIKLSRRNLTICVLVVSDSVAWIHWGVTVIVSVEVTETVAVAKIVDEVTIVDVDSANIIFRPWVT